MVNFTECINKTHNRCVSVVSWFNNRGSLMVLHGGISFFCLPSAHSGTSNTMYSALVSPWMHSRFQHLTMRETKGGSICIISEDKKLPIWDFQDMLCSERSLRICLWAELRGTMRKRKQHGPSISKLPNSHEIIRTREENLVWTTKE